MERDSELVVGVALGGAACEATVVSRHPAPAVGHSIERNGRAMEDATMLNDRSIARAVALMAAWNESDDNDTWFAVQLASQDLAGAVVTDTLLDESIRMITGLMSLAGRLLTELERQTGKPNSEILESAGLRSAD